MPPSFWQEPLVPPPVGTRRMFAGSSLLWTLTLGHEVRAFRLSLACRVTASYTTVGILRTLTPILKCGARKAWRVRSALCSWFLSARLLILCLGHCCLCSIYGSWGAASPSQQYINWKHSSLFCIWVVFHLIELLFVKWYSRLSPTVFLRAGVLSDVPVVVIK